jgi:hypothetical protein
MRVLLALDQSDIGEYAAAIGAWARLTPIDVHALSVVPPNDLDATGESSADEDLPGLDGQLDGQPSVLRE